MQQPEKIPESKMKVRFHDCDPFNHLNNARYIEYIMTARGDQLIDHYGLDIYALGREKAVGWVMAQTQISYFIPALLMEEVIIRTRLLDFSEKSLLMEGTMWNRDKTQMKALLWARLVHFNLSTQRSQQHAPELMELFQQICLPLEEPGRFEDRVHQLKQSV